MAVTIQDFSAQVIAKINTISLNWLDTTANEIAAKANRNVQLDGEAGQELRGSYRTETDLAQAKATIGSSKEEAFWEEYGTGSHADTVKNGGKKGRSDWWVWAPGWEPGSRPRYTEQEAKAYAADCQSRGIDAHASNGRDPSYTLEKSYINTKSAAIEELKSLLKRGLV